MENKHKETIRGKMSDISYKFVEKEKEFIYPNKIKILQQFGVKEGDIGDECKLIKKKLSEDYDTHKFIGGIKKEEDDWYYIHIAVKPKFVIPKHVVQKLMLENKIKAI